MVVSLITGFGLGNFENLSDDLPTIFTQNYGKTYFNLVNGIDKIIEKVILLNGEAPMNLIKYK